MAQKRTGSKAATVFAVIVVVFFVGSFIGDRVLMGQTYQRFVPDSPSLLPTEEYMADYDSTPVEFKLDGKTLRGNVYKADCPKGFIVFRHGIFSQHCDYLALISEMVDRGWTVLAYDAIGCGISDGDDVVGMAQSALDVAAAVNYVRENGLAGNLPLVLWGHSWGGYGVAAALDIAPDVDVCVTMSGYNEPIGVLMEAAERMMGPLATTQYPTMWLNNNLTFGPDGDRAAIAGINKTEAPVLIVHGTEDAVVGYNGSAIIAQRNAITNPGAEYLVFDQEGRNGHNSYFYSAAANAYLAEKQAELKALQEQYPDGIPDDVATAFLAGYDQHRGNEAAPDLIDAIDGFLTKAIGGDMATTKTDDFGALQSVRYSDSGDSLGSLYEVSVSRAEDGATVVTIRKAAMHSDPIEVGEYRVADDLLDRVSAIVDDAGMKGWGELPQSEFIALDGSTARISLEYGGKDARGFPMRLSYTQYDEMPDNGEAMRSIRELLQAYAAEGTQIRTYTE